MISCCFNYSGWLVFHITHRGSENAHIWQTTFKNGFFGIGNYFVVMQTSLKFFRGVRAITSRHLSKWLHVVKQEKHRWTIFVHLYFNEQSNTKHWVSNVVITHLNIRLQNNIWFCHSPWIIINYKCAFYWFSSQQINRSCYFVSTERSIPIWLRISMWVLSLQPMFVNSKIVF